MPRERHSASAAATLAVASLATALVLAIFTVPLTTLTQTADALGAGPGAQSWILSAMSVGAASGLLGSGAIGDDYGRRRIFLAGTLVMALASVLGALAPTALVLILARIAQGLGGAAILACGLGLIGQVYSDAALLRATAIWAGALGAGVAVGPILSSALSGPGTWTAPYWASAVATAILALAGRFFLAESRATTPRRIDIAGTLLLGSGIAALLAGLTQVRTGWAQPSVYVLFIGAAALLAGFVAVERRLTNPMLDLSLFRHADFAAATLAAFASGAGVLSIMSLVPLLLEHGLGAGGHLGAFVLLAWSATTAVAAIAARWLPFAPKTLLIGGLLGCAAGQLAVWHIEPDSSILRLLPGMFLAGAANGVLNAALGRQAMDLGSGIGLAICSFIVTHAGSVAGPVGLVTGWNHAVLVSVAFSLLGAVSLWSARWASPFDK